MSGDLPFARFTGDLLPSSWARYFSFCRRTLETVLCHESVRERLQVGFCLLPGSPSFDAENGYRLVSRQG